MAKKIGVGIIGVQPNRSWGAVAHFPAIQSLPEYEIRALSTTKLESAKAAAKTLGVPRAYDNTFELVNDPDVDLVVVTVKVPHHRELVTTALEAGKHVYCEWPLGNGLEEAIEMDRLAKEKGVHAVVGLQSRSAPIVNLVKDMIAEGYIGDVLSTTLIGSGMSWGPIVEPGNAYNSDKKNGATMLTIPMGHTLDALCYCLGEFKQIGALMANRRTSTVIMPGGQRIPLTAEDQVAVNGILTNGTFVSVHYRGAMCKGTNLLWEINGTEGDLRISGTGGHLQLLDVKLSGARFDDPVPATGDDLPGTDHGEAMALATEEYQTLQPIVIPEEYYPATSGVPAMIHNIARAYSRLAQDLRNNTRLCPSFEDGVRRHRMIEAIEQAAQTGTLQTL